ncbi:alpha/beta hydrolase [Stakelama sp. CBK3Z-3]|uniref:Alpha/beta hydrolase n=1 Tax=Stakelama flava TaxID=2860338 RepID=A0ABS6XGM9_9SPHN|nr:alpha/beta hydrolase [Stakelama flava]MBW4329372.1 alpha/beta hydrolase [Stakelama flava]
MAMVETSDGAQLYVKEAGQGRPLILIHGWPLNADSWDDQILALSNAGMRVIAYDRRGFGRSSQPPGGYDYDRFADDLAEVMAARGVESDASLVGFSMGGGEVARYLSRHGPDKLRSVALISSVVPYMLKTADNPDGVEQSVFDEMTAGMKNDRPDFFRSFLKDFFGVGMLNSPVSDAYLDWAWGLCMQAGLIPTLQAAKAFATTDFRPDLSAFTLPTLVIHGTGDNTVPIEATGRAVADAVPTATLREYEGSPHGLFATDGGKLTSDLLTFLKT